MKTTHEDWLIQILEDPEMHNLEVYEDTPDTIELQSRTAAIVLNADGTWEFRRFD